MRVAKDGRFARLFTGLQRGRYSAKGHYLKASAAQVKVASRSFSIRR